MDEQLPLTERELDVLRLLATKRPIFLSPDNRKCSYPCRTTMRKLSTENI